MGTCNALIVSPGTTHAPGTGLKVADTDEQNILVSLHELADRQTNRSFSQNVAEVS
jgi:hypothetical protein